MAEQMLFGMTNAERVATWFGRQPDLTGRVGAAIRHSLDFVLDPDTGRRYVDQLEKEEKAFIGKKVEISLRQAFGLPRGARDMVVEAVDVDVKCSVVRMNWEIPRECVGKVNMVIGINDRRGTFSVGLIEVLPKHPNLGHNQDLKRTLNGGARQEIIWLIQEASLPPHAPRRLRVA